MYALAQAESEVNDTKRVRYRGPAVVHASTLDKTLVELGRPTPDGGQGSFIEAGQSKTDIHLFYAGDLELLRRPSVAVVGSRNVSLEGAKRARRLSRELAAGGVTIVSGLAKGVDTNAHQAAIAAGGSTVAVIGTPLSKAYPAENGALQAQIAAEHLLMSPFPEGTAVYPSNFPKRNRVMAALSWGTVIIEATDDSGTLHQAVECEKLGRWLFILKSVVDDARYSWPKRYARYDRVKVVASAEDVLDVLAV